MRVRASAETMPLVTVCPTPKGLPMARTRSPTSSSSDSRSSRKGSWSPFTSILSTARSVRSSRRSTSASNSRRSARTTVTSSASLMTWLLVTTTPSGATRTPEPSEFCTRSCGRPKGIASPKKRRNKGSLRSAEGAPPCCFTTRREKTLTTAGAVFLTTGAKESWTCSRLSGTARWAAAGDAVQSSARNRRASLIERKTWSGKPSAAIRGILRNCF
jgi:hypothetical protein